MNNNAYKSINEPLTISIRKSEPDVLSQEEETEEALTRILDCTQEVYPQGAVFSIPKGYEGHIECDFAIVAESAKTEGGNLKSGYYRVSGNRIIIATKREYREYCREYE